MSDRELYGKRLTERSAGLIDTDSERLFAITFLNCLPKIPLYYQPEFIKVEGLGTTAPDFVTPFGNKGRMLYEVTMTFDTSGEQKKQRQWNILDAHQVTCPTDYHLEINGRALQCADTTMEMLEMMYRGWMTVETVQLKINLLGRDTQVFQATLMREMARV